MEARDKQPAQRGRVVPALRPHNAAREVLHACARGLRGWSNAEKLQDGDVNAMFKILASDPDGAAHSLGRGAVCWSCGYCGLARDPESEGTALRRLRAMTRIGSRYWPTRSARCPGSGQGTLTPEEAAQRKQARSRRSAPRSKECVRFLLAERSHAQISTKKAGSDGLSMFPMLRALAAGPRPPPCRRSATDDALSVPGRPRPRRP